MKVLKHIESKVFIIVLLLMSIFQVSSKSANTPNKLCPNNSNLDVKSCADNNFYFNYVQQSNGEIQFNFPFTQSIDGHSITSVSWHFGVSSPMAVEGSGFSPTYTYPISACGSDFYTVVVCVEYGTNLYCQFSQAIVVNNPNQVNSYNIIATPTGNCGEYTFTYIVNHPNPSILSPEWNFGDGQFDHSGQQSVTHTYPSNGSYLVTLGGDFRDNNCLVGTTVLVDDLPSVDFSYDLDAGSGPCDKIVDFTINNYDPVNYTYYWNFEGALLQATTGSTLHPFLTAGTHLVKLTIYNAQGCTQTISKYVVVGGIPATFVAADICVGEQLQVSGVIGGGNLYTWNIIDGSTTVPPQIGQYPSYTFTQSGTHNITLTVNSQNGSCSDVFVGSVNVIAVPDASFSYVSNGCGGVTLSLTNPGLFTNYSINYNHGPIITGYTTSNSFNGTDGIHSYTANGVYNITVTLNNGICSKTFIKAVNITDLPTVSIMSTSEYLCPNSNPTLEALVTGVSGSGSITYNWEETSNLGTSLGNLYQYMVLAGGTYQLTVTYNGCVAVSTIQIKDLADPTGTYTDVSNVTCLGNQNGSAHILLSPALLAEGCYVNGVYVNSTSYNVLGYYPIGNLHAGNNYVTITNAIDQCSSILTIPVESDGPSITNTIVEPSDCGGTDGSIAVTVYNSGTYTWYELANYPFTPISGATTNSISSLAPGDYVFEATSNGCTITQPINVPSSTLSLALLNTSLEVCMPGGTIDIEINDFDAEALLVWYKKDEFGVWLQIYPDNIGASPTGNQLYQITNGTGDYQVIGSLNGCSYTLPFTLVPTNIQVVLTKLGGYCSGENVTVASQVVGGDGDYTYDWSPLTNTTPTIDIVGLQGDINTSLTVTDGQGCTGTQTLLVSPLPPIHMADCGTTVPYTIFDKNDLSIYDVNGKIDESKVDLHEANTNTCEVWLCATNGTVAATSNNYSFEWFLPNQEDNEDITISFNNFDIANPTVLEYVDPITSNTITISSASITALSSVEDEYATNGNIPVLFTDNSSFYPFFVYDGPTNIYFDMNSTGVPYDVTINIPGTQSVLIHGHTGVTQLSYFLPGTNIYEVYVSDANGCRNGPYAIELTVPLPSNYPGFQFVWAKPNNDNATEPPVLVDENLKDNMAEAANSVLASASACMQTQGGIMATESTNCFDINSFRDEFTLSYKLEEYHYTLYYYDRAGQLTKTVPPEGVILLASADITNLKDYRKGIISLPGANLPTLDADLTPKHEMETKYQYNSLGQLISQTTPDGGTTEFIYDGKNRLRFSQNEQQLANSVYSYTKYDALGRIVEVGESMEVLIPDPNPTGRITNANVDDPDFPYNQNTQITRTVYSEPLASVSYYGIPQHYLQNRVSYVYNDVDGNFNTTNDQNHTYYSYDAHGNVEWLIQEVAGLGQNFVKYEYDLISGNVLKVKYNEQREDRFYHRYKYDTENRLEVVETSRDGLLWDKDANYQYYPHGPLQRTVLGEDHVQGLDYLYTIHGWLKSINTPSLSSNGTGINGIDKDGQLLAAPTTHNEVAQDRFGMSLGYYNGDYSNTKTFHNNGLGQLNGSYLYASNGTAGNDLFNGNITHWTHSQLEFNTITNKVEKIAARASTYQYDVLNRIKASQNQNQEEIGSVLSPSWNAVNDEYRTGYTYDANGNLQSLARFDEAPTSSTDYMDNLVYSYYEKDASGNFVNPGTGVEKTNRLYRVQDNAADPGSNENKGDLIGIHTYYYDKIGNLTREVAEEWLNADNTGGSEAYDVNTDITWTVYGKVASVHKEIASGGSIYQVMDIAFAYDASGNRIRKTVSTKSNPSGGLSSTPTYLPFETKITYYVRDAQGNTLAVYEDIQDDVESVHELNLIEEPIYGSDRLGQNIHKITLNSSAYGDPLPPLGTGVENKAEYQNWILSANGRLGNGLDNICNTKIDLINTSPFTANPADNEFLGVAKNGVAVAENTDGVLQFYTVLTEKYLGNADACLVYDAEGKLMKGTQLITNINTECKPIVVNLTGSNRYALVTLNNSNKPEYHIVDMDVMGYGLSLGVANAGEVTQVGNPLSTSSTASYGLHFTGFEDHVNEKMVVFTTRFIPLISQGEGSTEIVAYEFTGANTTPQEHVLYSLNSCADTKQGELQISQDGTKLLWYHHNEYVAGFDHRVAEIYEIELDASKTAITGNVQMINTSAAGNYGNGNVEGGANGSDILYAQRGVYKEAKTQDPSQNTEKHVWKYDPLTLNLTNITPSNPALSYLFSEIKRGVDGNYYIPNMGAQADQIQTWNGTNATAGLTAGAAYQLTGSMPTQVFKFFANNGGTSIATRIISDKQYELKDHLGNVRVVISDEKFLANEGTDATNIDAGDYFTPDVKSFADYYPFGSEMPNRSFSSGEYRYGFNGKEMDNDMGNTVGATYDYGFRIYDSRIAKFTSVDPLTKEYPFYTPYQFAGNKPIESIDLDGLEEVSNKVINGVRFIELKNVTVSIVIRKSTESLTAAMKKSATPGLDNYSFNTQMGEPVPGTDPKYRTAYTPQPNYRSQGLNVSDGKMIGGRGSNDTWYFSIKDGKVSADMGNPPINSDIAIGGGTPFYVNGLKYGVNNIWKSNTPKGINQNSKGAVSESDQQWLNQKSNGVYAGQFDAGTGKTIIGYNSTNKHWMIVSQENSYFGGMTNDEIRDDLISKGYNTIIGYDGSNSTILIKNNETITEPIIQKDNTMPSGATFSVPKAKKKK